MNRRLFRYIVTEEVRFSSLPGTNFVEVETEGLTPLQETIKRHLETSQWQRMAVLPDACWAVAEERRVMRVSTQKYGVPILITCFI
jgi:hypothetical protein